MMILSSSSYTVLVALWFSFYFGVFFFQSQGEELLNGGQFTVLNMILSNIVYGGDAMHSIVYAAIIYTVIYYMVIIHVVHSI